MILKIATFILIFSPHVFAKESFQIELLRQTVNGTERALLHMTPEKSTMGLTSNMLNFGEKTKIGTFEKKDKTSLKKFGALFNKLNLQKDPDSRHTTSPHAIEIWVNGKQIHTQTSSYKKIKNFSEDFVNKKNWKPIDAKLVSFNKNGQMKIESYEGRKRKSVEKFFSAELCKFKMSSYTCGTKLGAVYAPEWAVRLPGTVYEEK